MKQIATLLIIFVFFAACDKSDPSVSPNTNSTGGGGTGQGGSLARFTIAQNHLYVVDDRRLYTYSLANSSQPQIKSTINISMDIETIYAYQDKLFIGSRQAMYIYSISDAANPQRLGSASHVRACDPVVAQNNWAYVTVRNGSNCGGTLSALMVYDVTNVMNPSLRKTVNMESPYGLGIRSNRLYVCNGSNGLNVYDVSDPDNPLLIRALGGESYYDVIPTNNLLICMVQGGTVLYQYDAAQELVLAAKISN